MAKRKQPAVRTPGAAVGLAWSTILNALILLLALYVFLPQIGRFQTSTQLLKQAQPALVAVALTAVFVTCFFAAGAYRLLGKKRLMYRRVLGVQLAGLFANRLLPAGLGGISLNMRFLVKSRHSLSEAGSVAAANNLLGFLAHLVLLGTALSVSRRPVGFAVNIEVPDFALFVCLAVFCAGGIVVWAAKGLRRRIAITLREAALHLIRYRKHPARLLLAVLCQAAVTVLYAACFYLCIRAVGLNLPPTEVFLAFSLGAAAAAVTPTPGGLVGAEAGLLAGLVGYGLPEAAALSAVLLYRLLSYWLPLLPGAVTFRLLQWRGVI